jgi:hypothetical protein
MTARASTWERHCGTCRAVVLRASGPAELLARSVCTECSRLICEECAWLGFCPDCAETFVCAPARELGPPPPPPRRRPMRLMVRRRMWRAPVRR